MGKQMQMNKAKRVYIDKDGNMCRQKERYECKEIEPFIVKGKLKLANIGWQNSGVYFAFKAEDGKMYFMSQGEFEKYIKRHEVVIDGEFEFLQQGRIYSIGEIVNGE